jgi:histidinol-phosphate aminotransferase
MFDLNNILRENIKKLVPYSSARDEYKGTEGIFLDANENSFGSPLMLEVERKTHKNKRPTYRKYFSW